MASAAVSIAQTTTGTIVGIVTDTTGGVLPTATVTITNLGTGLSRTVFTASDGAYTAPALPTGQYRVDVTLDGFKSFSQTGITLEVGQNARVDARLDVGAVSEQILVTGRQLLVDTKSSSVGVVVDNQRLENLPMNGRGVLSLALLVPGIGASTLPPVVIDQRQGPSISAGGSRTNQNNVLLDGAQLATSLRNVAQNLPSPDSLQEFQILTNTYSAEYGRSAGATLMAITRSGTNELRSGLWEYTRHDALNTTNFFAPTATKPYLRQNQFGGRIGGPIVRNRTFVFGSYEGIRVRQQAIIQFNPPTAAARTGDLSAVTTPIVDPLTGVAFPGNRIPASRLDPMALKILELYVPVPNNGVQSSTVNDRPTDGDQFTTKIDHRFSSDDILSGRYYRNRTTGIIGGGNINLLASERGNLIQGTTISNTHVFRADLLTEARVSFTKLETEGPAAAANQTPQQLGARYSQDGSIPLAPTVNVPGSFSMTPNQPWLERSNLVDVDLKASWDAGRHGLRFGFQALHQKQRLQTQFQSSGVFTFDGSITGNSVADFLIGRPVSLVQSAVLDNQEQSRTWAAFVQDDVRAGRVTLNLGLRYDVFEPWEEQDGRAAIVRPGQQSTRFPNAPPGLVYPDDAGVPAGMVPTDKNNFAPRIGAAWDLRGDGRTSLRAAYGIFYTPQGSITVANQNEAPPFVQVVSITNPAGLINPYEGRTSPFPYVASTSGAALFAFPTQVFSIDPVFETGYIHQYNVNVQRQIGADIMVQVGYFGASGRHLTSSREINAAVFGPGATATNAQQRRPYFPQYFAGISQAFSDARSEYDALQVSATKKFSHSYTVQLAYTLSKSMDDRSAGNTDAASVQNPNDPHDGEWALSDFDQRHILRVNGVWEVRGWRLAGIVSAASGQPFTITSGRDRALVGPSRGLGAQRPDLVTAPELSTDRPRADVIAQYFNTVAFALPALGAYGNGGRNRLIAPGLFSTDASISRRVSFSSGRRGVEMRVEAFNLFNRVNLGVPVAVMSSPSFGRIVSAADGRVIQLGFRADF